MSRTVFNKENVDYTKEPMFFGAPLNTQRFDKARYPKFNQLNKQMISFHWVAEEVSLLKDIADYQNLSDHEKFIFTENTKFQTLLDSIVGRSPAAALLPIVSLPELEAAITTWQQFETNIHSKSYSYIVQNVYPNPSEILDEIITSPEIQKRAEYIVNFYDDLINYADQYRVNGVGDLYELKKKLFLTVVSINILEGIRFYVSFACNFALAENKKMEGSAKILSLIARDENLHMALTTTIISNWRSGQDDPDFLKIIEETRETVHEMFKVVMDQEKEWADHLMSKGSILGLTSKVLYDYVDYLGDKRARAIGYKLPNLNARNNPIPWIQNWLASGSIQVAPQETEISSYVVGGVKQDIDDSTFKGFEL